MGESASQIAQELDQKRADATDKIEKIENQVAQTAEDIKDTMDFRKHVEQRPLVSLGAAFMGGMILGGLVGGGGQRQQGARSYGHESGGYSDNGNQCGGLIDSLRSAAKKAGLEDTINSAAAAVMANAGDRLKSTVDQSYPGLTEKYRSATQAQGGVTDKAKAAASTDGDPPKPA